MLDRARDSLERTPELLPVLSAAGVVDAGAKGFVSLLEGVVMFLRGDPFTTNSGIDPLAGPPVVTSIEYPERVEQYQFCTEALVRGDALPDQSAVRDHLRTQGDSLIVIRSDDVLKVHVHTDAPEKVFAYFRGLGDLVTHKAEDMKAQYEAVERASSSHLALVRRPVGVLTDSAADLPEEIVRAHGIQVVPMILVDGDVVYRDGVDLTAEQFHQMMASQEELPTTSQPPPAAFSEGFRRAAADAEQVVAVTLSSGLSGTFSAAEAAAAREPDLSIHLADSRGASLLQGLLVLKATELAELAVPADEIVTELNRIRDQSGVLCTIETYDRLLASGRISRSQAFFANLLNLKPILAIGQDGTVVPCGKAIGRRRVIATLLDVMARDMGRVPDKVRFGIVHVGIPQIVAEVRELLVSRYGEVEILSAPVTPVIATHLGVGAWGIAYMVEDSPSQCDDRIVTPR
jgi:DegV family protein with EDD domain